MKKRLLILTVMAIIGCFAAGLMVNAFFGDKHANAESTKEHIKRSMEETKKWKANLLKLHKEANKLLREKGYDVQLSTSGEYYSSRSPEVLVQGNKDELDKHGKEIKQTLQKLVNKYDLGDMAIRLGVQKQYRISEKDRKLMEQTREILDIVQPILVQKGVGSYSAGINARTPMTIEIELQNPPADFTHVEEQLEKQIHDAIYAKSHLDFKVNVTKKSGSEIRDMKWAPIFDAIMEETKKEFDEYKGFGYSFHPMPLQIVIKTSLSNGAKEQAEKMEQYVKQIIEIKREELKVEKIPYKVIIRGEGNKQLN